jgi:hypothetical protein
MEASAETKGAMVGVRTEAKGLGEERLKIRSGSLSPNWVKLSRT